MQDSEFAKGSWTLVAGLAMCVWIFLALVGAAWLAFISMQGDLGCALSGSDSNFGTLSWSALPPGPVCTYTADWNGVDKVDGPSPVTSVWLLTLVALAVIFVWSVRRAVRERAAETRAD
jgi:hypothetical protein